MKHGVYLAYVSNNDAVAVGVGVGIGVGIGVVEER